MGPGVGHGVRGGRVGDRDGEAAQGRVVDGGRRSGRVPGPGTPYSAAHDARASSPDCGYTYRRASVGVPGGAFTVSVEVTWDVTWHGGGQSGVVPGQVMRAQRQLVVDEVQAVVR